MNPDNPIVKLCVAGMRAEGEGHFEEACLLFTQAWDARQDPYDACIAAHYLARHQADAASMLHWNQVALDCAKKLDDENMVDFYPSLYLNLGWSHEQLGDEVEARRYYELAAVHLDDLPAGPYREIVERGVVGGQARLSFGSGDTTRSSQCVEIGKQ